MSQKELLAFSVVDLAKALVLADNHFLSAAVGRLEVIPGIFAAQFACDGYALGIDTDKVLETYVRTREAPKHDLLHSILHCLFLHPYVGPAIKRPLWNLACDISVEHNVAELCGPRPGGRGDAMLSAFRKISESFDKWPSAESIYKQLCDGKWKTAVSGWEELFFSDDHGPWYPAPQSDGPEAQTDQQGGQLQASGGSGSEQSEQQAGGGSGS
ncbi:MAG: hypothetical protein IKD70_07355, partial [Eggerthellaceae bacterium]|nr:hypothetical protein [Eggerthellaceae bacterium]